MFFCNSGFSLVNSLEQIIVKKQSSTIQKCNNRAFACKNVTIIDASQQQYICHHFWLRMTHYAIAQMNACSLSLLLPSEMSMKPITI